jgi:hypothetical protein
MSRSLISTATALCMGSLLLLGCQPTGTVNSGHSGSSTTVEANGGGGNGGGGNGGGGSTAPALDPSCPALHSAADRLTDLSMLLGNLTGPVLDQARAGDAGGLDPRTLGKTLGVIQPLGAASSDMAASLATLQPVFDLLRTSLQADVPLDPTALDQLRAGGGVVGAAADQVLDTLKDKCPIDPNAVPATTTTTVPADPTTTVPADPADPTATTIDPTDPTATTTDPTTTVPADPATTVPVETTTTVPVETTTTVPAETTTTQP